MGIDIRDNRIVIDCQTLIGKHGISKNTVYGGIQEYQNQQTYNWENFKNGKEVYVFVDTIPLRTRKKLPPSDVLKAFVKAEKTDSYGAEIYKQLQHAKNVNFTKHRTYYRDKYGLTSESAVETSMKRAVWDRLLQIYNENKTGTKGGLKKGSLEIMLNAYNRVYTDGYSSVQSFIRAIKTVETRGVDAICVDGRAIKNSQKPALKYDERHIFLLRGIVSSGKAYKAPQIMEILAEACNDEGIECPSLSWVKAQKQDAVRNIEISNNRYGADKTDKLAPYTGIKSAYYANDQYQIDGWDLPFYYLGKDTNGNNRLKKLTLIAVRDAYSRKIVGYSIGRSENRLTLFEALQDAVANTGALPFELVSDNHSYNETKEVDYFKNEAQKLGFTWTVDSNPKRKALAERYFSILGEKFCKRHYGYVGQGIKTRDKDGRTKQELIDKYQKSGQILTEDAIKLIAIDVVQKFNKTPLGTNKKSPNQLFEESLKPHSIEVNLYERLKLFTKRTEYKVRRGQINIEIAGNKYEFQLPAALYSECEGKSVGVRYDSIDIIYLFDKHTDQPITALEQKEKAAGALANQTEKDREILNRSTGRFKGVITQARKENEELAIKAQELSPSIYETLNKRLTPKDTCKLLEEEAVSNEAIKRGINLNQVESIPTFSEVENPAFRERKRSRKEKSPFAPSNHEISTIDLDEI